MSIVLLILLGAADEHAGLDKRLKTDTRPVRQFALYRQRMRWYELLPVLPEPVLRLLMDTFARLLARLPTMREVFSSV